MATAPANTSSPRPTGPIWTRPTCRPMCSPRPWPSAPRATGWRARAAAWSSAPSTPRSCSGRWRAPTTRPASSSCRAFCAVACPPCPGWALASWMCATWPSCTASRSPRRAWRASASSPMPAFCGCERSRPSCAPSWATTPAACPRCRCRIGACACSPASAPRCAPRPASWARCAGRTRATRASCWAGCRGHPRRRSWRRRGT
mmetsp:Transcript_58720/g.138295  ORF Transcript_58720/g.138295 Transcript_58720/m.138295 type:complete len:203 (-) Transcript_58720:228-836(-)